MAQIELRSKLVAPGSIFGGQGVFAGDTINPNAIPHNEYHHLFLIAHLDDGMEYILRAGPPPGEIVLPFGRKKQLIPVGADDFLPYTKANHKYHEDWCEPGGFQSKVVYNGTDDEVLETFRRGMMFLQEIRNENITYTKENNNSNKATYIALLGMGIEPPPLTFPPMIASFVITPGYGEFSEELSQAWFERTKKHVDATLLKERSSSSDTNPEGASSEEVETFLKGYEIDVASLSPNVKKLVTKHSNELKKAFEAARKEEIKQQQQLLKSKQFMEACEGMRNTGKTIAHIGLSLGNESVYKGGVLISSVVDIFQNIAILGGILGAVPTGLALLTPYSAIVMGVFTIFSLFRKRKSSGENPMAAVMQQLQLLSQQIQALHLEMREHFSHVYQNQQKLMETILDATQFLSNQIDRRIDDAIVPIMYELHGMNDSLQTMYGVFFKQAHSISMQGLEDIIYRDNRLLEGDIKVSLNEKRRELLRDLLTLEGWLTHRAASKIYNGQICFKPMQSIRSMEQTFMLSSISTTSQDTAYLTGLIGYLASQSEAILLDDFPKTINLNKLINPQIWGNAINTYLQIREYFSVQGIEYDAKGGKLTEIKEVLENTITFIQFLQRSPVLYQVLVDNLLETTTDIKKVLQETVFSGLVRIRETFIKYFQDREFRYDEQKFKTLRQDLQESIKPIFQKYQGIIKKSAANRLDLFSDHARWLTLNLKKKDAFAKALIAIKYLDFQSNVIHRLQQTVSGALYQLRITQSDFQRGWLSQNYFNKHGDIQRYIDEYKQLFDSKKSPNYFLEKIRSESATLTAIMNREMPIKDAQSVIKKPLNVIAHHVVRSELAGRSDYLLGRCSETSAWENFYNLPLVIEAILDTIDVPIELLVAERLGLLLLTTEYSTVNPKAHDFQPNIKAEYEFILKATLLDGTNRTTKVMTISCEGPYPQDHNKSLLINSAYTAHVNYCRAVGVSAATRGNYEASARGHNCIAVIVTLPYLSVVKVLKSEKYVDFCQEISSRIDELIDSRSANDLAVDIARQFNIPINIFCRPSTPVAEGYDLHVDIGSACHDLEIPSLFLLAESLDVLSFDFQYKYDQMVDNRARYKVTGRIKVDNENYELYTFDCIGKNAHIIPAGTTADVRAVLNHIVPLTEGTLNLVKESVQFAEGIDLNKLYNQLIERINNKIEALQYAAHGRLTGAENTDWSSLQPIKEKWQSIINYTRAYLQLAGFSNDILQRTSDISEKVLNAELYRYLLPESISSAYTSIVNRNEALSINTAVWYDDEDINLILNSYIDSKLGGRSEGNSFLLARTFNEANRNYNVAVTPAIDQQAYAQPITMWLDKFSQSAPHDPNNPDDRRDVFDELSECFREGGIGKVKIVFPYNFANIHWMTGEIILERIQTETLKLEINTHDPRGRGEMLSSNARLIEDAVRRRLNQVLPQPLIVNLQVSSPESHYASRQSLNDGSSCGPIVAEDIVKRIQGKSLDISQPYPTGAETIRKEHLNLIENSSLRDIDKNKFRDKHTSQLKIVDNDIENNIQVMRAMIRSIIDLKESKNFSNYFNSQIEQTLQFWLKCIKFFQATSQLDESEAELINPFYADFSMEGFDENESEDESFGDELTPDLKKLVVPRSRWKRVKSQDGRDQILGSGNFGITYAGKTLDHKNNQRRDVAIKTIRAREIESGTQSSTSLRMTFFNEVRNLSQFYNPIAQNVISFYGVTKHKNNQTQDVRYSLLLEKAEMSLEKFLDEINQKKRSRLSWNEKVKLIRDIANGIREIHTKRIEGSNDMMVHSDIKDSNILLIIKSNCQMIAKISDLGISKVRDIATTIGTVRPGERAGTKLWQAPEVLLGKNHEWSSDIFSFGLVMWRILHDGKPISSEKDRTLLPLDSSKLKNLYSIKIDFRLPISNNLPKELAIILRSCWEMHYELDGISEEFDYRFKLSEARRPTAVQVVKMLDNLLKKAQPENEYGTSSSQKL